MIVLPERRYSRRWDTSWWCARREVRAGRTAPCGRKGHRWSRGSNATPCAWPHPTETERALSSCSQSHYKHTNQWLGQEW